MQNENQIVLTFLGRIDSLEKMADVFIEELGDVFKSLSEENGKYSIVLQDDSIVEIEIPEHVKGEEAFANQINGMRGFYYNVETEKTNIKEILVANMAYWNSMIGIRFDDDGNKDRNNFLFANALATAKKLNSYIMLSNLDIYDGDCKLVFAKDGKSDLESFNPVFPAQSVFEHKAQLTENDTARYEKSKMILKENNIAYIEEMALALREGEIEIKPIREICERLVSLFTVSVFSEALLNEELTNDDAFSEIVLLNEKFNVISYLTDAELDYTNQDEISNHDAIQFIWRYEALNILFWALGFIDKLPKENEICDVPVIAKTIREFEDLEDLINSANLISKNQLADYQDLLMRYHWACIENRMNGKEAPEGLDEGVIMERHKAINWLITNMFGANWDDVQTPA